MKIEIVNKEGNKLTKVIERPRGYLVPEGKCILESSSSTNEKDFQEENKCIHIDGLFINFFKRTAVREQKVSVRSDSPYTQLHFELGGGAAYYQHNGGRFSFPTDQGEFSLFHIPHLDGTLIDPPCRNAKSLEIEFSSTWLQEYIGRTPSVVAGFIDSMDSSRPTLLGGRSYPITPAVHQIIYGLYDCLYIGHIKRLYVEGKVMELLALQLHQAGIADLHAQKTTLSKQDIDQLYFIKEKITADLSKDYTIEELSYMAFMNRTKMQAGFKQLFGCTIHEFVVESRMMEAYRMLTDEYSSNWNVTEIAHSVGYRRHNHFSTVFKKRFGVPPSFFLKRQ